MDKLKSRYTEYAFKAARGLAINMSGVAVDKGPIGFNGENIVEIGTGAAGGFYAASAVAGTPDIFDQNTPTSIYIKGTANYDGLRRIYNVRSARYVQIFAEFVAESFAAPMSQRVGFKAETASELGGFSLHLTNSSATDILECVIYSAKGSAFDNKIYSKDLTGVQDINHMFKPPRYLAPGDRIDFTRSTTNGTASGIILYVRKLS